MRRPLLSIAAMALLFAGCTDLTFLDAAVTEAGRTEPAPELLPRAQLDLPTAEDAEPSEETERLLNRGAALQRRAAAAQ
ncbi:hypothetical protein [Dinoroseobacter sp. S375]|uniref:hypothetical protein n=1 Tax=Dinoroseobacter sp. S375 TaxID=3415136 RepID=UPI003C7E4BF0